jgi:hypothetical protein
VGSDRHVLEANAAAAWARYESTVRTGGTPEQRRYACDAAVEADRRLAAFDHAQLPQRVREAAARALSGA